MNNETLPDELRAQYDDQLTTDAAKAIERLLACVSALRETVQAMVRAKVAPLTLEQISDAVYKADAQHNIEFMTSGWPVIFTRVIESAHGITGEPR